jgi:glycosyltransferase involved in cell wall biosynthesis
VTQPVVALFPWGDLIDEDFLDRLGVSLDDFRTSFRGSWMFGYADALSRKGVECVLIGFSRRTLRTLRFAHEPSGTRVVIVPAPFRLWPLRLLRRALRRFPLVHDLAAYAALPFFRLRRELRRIGASAILCQEYEYQRFDLLAHFGLPLYGTFQGGGGRPLGPIERFLRPRTFRRVAGVIAGTKGECERVRRTYGPDVRIAMIPNPVPIEEWHPMDRGKARSSLDIRAATRVAMWHGRVEIGPKGLDVLLDAWNRIRASDRLLLLVGSGDNTAMQRLLEGRPKVRWISSFVADRELLRTCLSASDVYVFPSRHEGFPVAPVEALAAGVPLVVSDASGLREIAGEGEDAAGIVVPISDAAATASAIDALFEDRTLSANARKRAQRFSSALIGDQLRAFLFPGLRGRQ